MLKAKPWICTLVTLHYLLHRCYWIEIRWFRETEDAGRRQIRPHRRDIGPLLLSGVRREDSGLFICRVSNSDLEVRVTLEVYGETIDTFSSVLFHSKFLFFKSESFFLFKLLFVFNSLRRLRQSTLVDLSLFAVSFPVGLRMRFGGLRMGPTFQIHPEGTSGNRPKRRFAN